MRVSPPGPAKTGGVPSGGFTPPVVRILGGLASAAGARLKSLRPERTERTAPPAKPEKRPEPAAPVLTRAKFDPRPFPRAVTWAAGEDPAADDSVAEPSPAARVAPAPPSAAKPASRPAPTPASSPAPGPVASGIFRDRIEAFRDALAARFGDVWWIGSADPITLRLPRGVTVLVVTGVVGIIVMAFAVGRRSGHEQLRADAPAGPALAQAEAGLPADRFGFAGAAPDGVPGGGEWFGSSAVAAEEAEVDPVRLQARFDAGLDPRVLGLNYLVYMTATRRECLRLADFLGHNGVQAVVIPSSRKVKAGDGDGRMIELTLYQVVDVGQGFSRNEYVRGEHEGFRSERMELGRAWKRHNGGRGSDLADMEFYRYQPKG